MELPKFSVEYIDGTSFIGESLMGDWHSVHNGRIKKLTFSYAGVSLNLENFKSYNHLVERVALVGKKGNTVTKYLIMARLEKTTHIYEYNLQTNRSGRKVVPIGQEYNGQIITGWKDGVIEGVARFKHGKF